MNKSLMVLCFAGLLAACASQPEDIRASHRSAEPYKGLDCTQLSIEADRVSSNITELYNSLQKKANNDAMQVGVGFLVWPVFLLLEGGDDVEAHEYARLKGQREAIEKVSLKKKCDIRFSQ